MEAQEAVNKLCEHLLGKDWCPGDWANNITANEKIVDEIIGRYKGATETPVNKWRKSRLHRKCEFCKHYELVPCEMCKAKNKRVDSRDRKPFCSCFQLKPYKEN